MEEVSYDEDSNCKAITHRDFCADARTGSSDHNEPRQARIPACELRRRAANDLERLAKRQMFMEMMKPIWSKLDGVTEKELEDDFKSWRKSRRRSR